MIPMYRLWVDGLYWLHCPRPPWTTHPRSPNMEWILLCRQGLLIILKMKIIYVMVDTSYKWVVNNTNIKIPRGVPSVTAGATYQQRFIIYIFSNIANLLFKYHSHIIQMQWFSNNTNWFCIHNNRSDRMSPISPGCCFCTGVVNRHISSTTTVETLYSTIYYNKYFIELHIDKSTQYVALWTHKRHPIPRPFGWAMECLLWVLQQKLIVL